MRYIQSFQNDAAIQGAVDNNLLWHPYIALNDQTGKIDWDSKEISPELQYFTIEALEAGDFTIVKGERVGIYHSLNGGEWRDDVVSGYQTHTITLSLNKGDKVRIKADGEGLASSLCAGNTIKYKVYGNIESLEYGDNFIGQTEIRTSLSAFDNLFMASTGLIDASKLVLPATTLKELCYGTKIQNRGMFHGCTSLLYPPELPATTLAKDCYFNMFHNCTSMTTAPELPAVTLVSGCYGYMFQGCSSLNYVKCMATSGINNNTNTPRWLWDVSSTGTFVKPAGVTWKKGSPTQAFSYCIPPGWTQVNAQ